MTTATRTVAERRFHDEQARSRAETFAREPARLSFADGEYLDHESWIRSAMTKLGPVRGRRVLDYGCGHGMAAVVLARRGAIVTACDLAPEYVAEAGRRSAANDVTMTCVAANGERLPFATASFDAIWGHAIIHHLDVPTAAAELRRVLKPGGVVVLCEPWAGNPLVEAARRWLPYAGKHRTVDETPLGPKQIEELRSEFDHVTAVGQQFMGMARRMVPAAAALDRFDERLLEAVPALGRWCRYVVLTMR